MTTKEQVEAAELEARLAKARAKKARADEELKLSEEVADRTDQGSFIKWVVIGVVTLVLIVWGLFAFGLIGEANKPEPAQPAPTPIVDEQQLDDVCSTPDAADLYLGCAAE